MATQREQYRDYIEILIAQIKAAFTNYPEKKAAELKRKSMLGWAFSKSRGDWQPQATTAVESFTQQIQALRESDSLSLKGVQQILTQFLDDGHFVVWYKNMFGLEGNSLLRNQLKQIYTSSLVQEQQFTGNNINTSLSFTQHPPLDDERVPATHLQRQKALQATQADTFTQQAIVYCLTPRSKQARAKPFATAERPKPVPQYGGSVWDEVGHFFSEKLKL